MIRFITFVASWFLHEKRWADFPSHLPSLVMAATAAGHPSRNPWSWGGAAALRANGDQLALRSVPAAEWAEVENAAKDFWEEVAQEGEVHQKIVNIFKEYNSVINQAGAPYNFE